MKILVERMQRKICFPIKDNLFAKDLNSHSYDLSTNKVEITPVVLDHDIAIANTWILIRL